MGTTFFQTRFKHFLCVAFVPRLHVATLLTNIHDNVVELERLFSPYEVYAPGRPVNRNATYCKQSSSPAVTVVVLLLFHVRPHPHESPKLE